MTHSVAFDYTRVLPFPRGGYRAVLELQHRVLEERIRKVVPDTILLGEHERVITLGRATKVKPEGLPLPVVEVERGGQATWHGPGQLVGYPIVDLVTLGISVREYLSSLERALIAALAEFAIAAQSREGATGVWVGDRKVASIGVAVRRFVTYHGFALNHSPDLSDFRFIQPCGFSAEVMTSMEQMLGTPPSFGAVTLSVLRSLVRTLDLAPPIWETSP